MLTGTSFLSYQAAPLKSIRDAIQDDENHIVRVNEEGTGEIYDLKLSHSGPYASPIERKDASSSSSNASTGGGGGGMSMLAANDALTKARSEPEGRSVKAGPVANAGKHALRKDASAPASWHSTTNDARQANSSDATEQGPKGSPTQAIHSSGRRLLQLPQIVSRRNAHAQNAQVSSPAANDTDGIKDSSETSKLHADERPNGLPNMLRMPSAGELPPSPPLEPDMQQYLSANGIDPANALSSSYISMEPNSTNSALSAKTIGDETQDSPQGPGRGSMPTKRVTPRRAATDEVVSVRTRSRTPLREGSNASMASSAYQTASSHSQDGSEEEASGSQLSSQSRFLNTPLTAEPSSTTLRPPGQHIDAATSSTSLSQSRNASPSPSGAHLATASRQGMPPRRNTTGSNTGQPARRRPGSVGSNGTRDSQRRSREREIDEVGPGGAPSSPVAPLRTGDAGFDEAIAKQYETIRRERENKKYREQQLDGTKQEAQTQQENTLRGGTALVRARSSRRDTGDEPKALIGNVIGEGHANYVLMYNMLTGIRIGVSRCQAKMKRPLTDADYTAKHKFTFDIIGNELTPSAKYDFKFKDYAPWVFRELREHFHLDAADYLLSLTAKYILSELGSPGKSGSFFYFSRDYRFIIKTIRRNEHKFLRRILKDYHLHIKDNPHTLLSRFYGLHRVKLPGGKKIHFVIMNNLFPPHKDIHETYDLKGSAIGREYPEEKAAQKKGAILKDLNWVKRGRELEFGPAKRALLEAQIRSDVSLLQRLGIMDYSLLIGLHDMKRGNREGLRQDALQVVQPDKNPMNQNTANGGPPGMLRREPTTRVEKEAYALRNAVRRSDAKALGSTSTAKLPERETSDRHHFLFYQDEGGFRSTDEHNNATDWIYYFGIIDTLTLYNSVKRGEHFFKSLTNSSQMISAVNPVAYGNRFCNFLFSLVKGADKSKRPRMQ